MTARRFYQTHRPSLVSATVAPMDRADAQFWTLRKQGVPTMAEWLERKSA